VSKDISVLDLSSLAVPPGMPAVCIAAGAFFADAAGVCLEIAKHSQGASLAVHGVQRRDYAVLWPAIDDQKRRTHADTQDATEFGACALAFVLTRELTDYEAVEQARKGGGFDYWLGRATEPDLFCARLEISGILSGDDGEIKKRVTVKKKQTTKSDDTGLPGYACVVEFSRPEVHFVKR
jgi:hypothetical protein